MAVSPARITIVVKGKPLQTLTAMTESIAQSLSPRKLMILLGERIPQWTRHQLITLYVESRIQSQAWAESAIGMTQGMTSSPRRSRRPPKRRFRINAQGIPMQSLMISVPKVYLNVFLTARVKFGSCTTPLPLVLTLVRAGTRMSSFSSRFKAARSA